MFRNCIRLSGQLVRGAFLQDQSLVKINHEITKRWAGHSKWSNIKHTKMEKDQSKSMVFSRLSKRISQAVKDGGGGDPKLNYKLRAVLDEARKLSMPNSSIEKAIKNAQLGISAKPYWVSYEGPGGLIVGFEVMFPTIPQAITALGQYAKKVNLKHLKHPGENYIEMGVIISEPLPNVENSYDQALEDAIEFGIEEVFKEDDNTLMFKCTPNKLDVAHKKLADKGYNVQSATTELEFNKFIDLSKQDMELLNTIIERMQQNIEDLIRITTNISEVDPS